MRHLIQPLFLFVMTIFTVTVVIPDTVSADTGETLDEIDLWADISEEINEAPGYEDSKDNEREIALSLGIIGGVSPDYEGSSDYEFSFGPNIGFSWRDRIFYKGKSLGVNAIREKNLKAGPILSWGSGRDEDDNDRLDGLGDVDSSIEAGGFVSYRMKPMRFRMEIRQDIISGHEGALVELSAGTSLPFTKPLVFVALGTTWASDDYMESFFGVDEGQSAASGLKRYSADSGIKDISLGVTAGHMITKRWRLGGKVEYKRLMGDAADSPIVDDKDQFIAGITLSYHIGLKILPDDLEPAK